MARTTEDLVKGVLMEDYNATPEVGAAKDLAPFINLAAAIVGKVEACATSKGEPQSEDVLTQMETWLAAHFYQQSDKGYSSRSTQGASGSFHGQWGKYLDNTNYGQTAQMLDFSGCLSTIASGSTRRVASLNWGGKTDAEKLSWDQRN